MAAYFKYIKEAASNAFFRILCALSLLISTAVMCLPWFRWDRPYAENGMMVMASKFLHFDLTAVFPSFKLGGHTMILAAFWAAAIIAVNFFVISRQKDVFK